MTTTPIANDALTALQDRVRMLEFKNHYLRDVLMWSEQNCPGKCAGTIRAALTAASSPEGKQTLLRISEILFPPDEQIGKQTFMSSDAADNLEAALQTLRAIDDDKLKTACETIDRVIEQINEVRKLLPSTTPQIEPRKS